MDLDNMVKGAMHGEEKPEELRTMDDDGEIMPVSNISNVPSGFAYVLNHGLSTYIISSENPFDLPAGLWSKIGIFDLARVEQLENIGDRLHAALTECGLDEISLTTIRFAAPDAASMNGCHRTLVDQLKCCFDQSIELSTTSALEAGCRAGGLRSFRQKAWDTNWDLLGKIPTGRSSAETSAIMDKYKELYGKDMLDDLSEHAEVKYSGMLATKRVKSSGVGDGGHEFPPYLVQHWLARWHITKKFLLGHGEGISNRLYGDPPSFVQALDNHPGSLRVFRDGFDYAAPAWSRYRVTSKQCMLMGATLLPIAVAYQLNPTISLGLEIGSGGSAAVLSLWQALRTPPEDKGAGAGAQIAPAVTIICLIAYAGLTSYRKTYPKTFIGASFLCGLLPAALLPERSFWSGLGFFMAFGICFMSLAFDDADRDWEGLQDLTNATGRHLQRATHYMWRSMWQVLENVRPQVEV